VFRSHHHRNHRIAIIIGATLALAFAVTRPADAQRRRPRQARTSGSIVLAGGGLYPHFVYVDAWSQWGRGPIYPPYGYYRYGYPEGLTGSVRLQVTPRDAEVFVDGYHAGVVDEFDGIIQRLRLTPGGHDIEIYLDGYRTETRSIYVGPGSDHRIRFTMTALGADETSVLPEPSDARAPAAMDPASERPVERLAPRPAREAPAAVGVLALRLQPADAEVVIDDEVWSRPAGREVVTIELPVGEHRLEVRREGFAPYTETVLIQRGRTLSLNVVLR
jgi:hypothetical protein